MTKRRRSDQLRKLFGKGYIEVLFFIDEKRSVRFSDIRRLCLDSGIVGSRGTVPIILRNLVNQHLIEREVVATRPIQTFYKITELGKQVAHHLRSVKQLLKG
jgi:DNA-binding HxlR family transcriptional regulator